MTSKRAVFALCVMVMFGLAAAAYEPPPGDSYALRLVIDGLGIVDVDPPGDYWDGVHYYSDLQPPPEVTVQALVGTFIRWEIGPTGEVPEVYWESEQTITMTEEVRDWTARAIFVGWFEIHRDTGDVLTRGAFHGQSFITVNGDLAEWVPVSGPVEPGHVLEIDPESVGRYRLAQGPCTASVAGVVSTQPGLILRDSAAPNDGQALLALLGIVPVKVTNAGGSIAIGDLLVVSSTPGYAMRWDPHSGSVCGLVGKALEPWDEGSGMIEVLLTR